MYPNPATSTLTIKHGFANTDDVLIRVFDQIGRQVDAIHFKKNQLPGGYLTLNVNAYSSGVYYLNFVKDGNALGTTKFIKQ